MGGRDTVDRGGGVGGPPRRKRTMGPFPSEFKNHEVERKISEKKDRLGVADYQSNPRMTRSASIVSLVPVTSGGGDSRSQNPKYIYQTQGRHG